MKYVPEATLMLLSLFRLLLLGLAAGTVFIRRRLFGKLSEGQSLLIGVAATPLLVSLLDYLLGLVFVGWPSVFYFLAPMLLSAAYLSVGKRFLTAWRAVKAIAARIRAVAGETGAWLLFDGVLALGIVLYYSFYFNGTYPLAYAANALRTLNSVGILAAGAFLLMLTAAAVFVVREMVRGGTLGRNLCVIAMLVIAGTVCVHSLSVIARPGIDSDRSHYELDARYFLEDKNSWEVDRYSDEKAGSSLADDHGPLWIVYLADAKMTADALGQEDSLRSVNYSLIWTFLCFNLLLFLTASYAGGSNRTGVVALFLFHIYVYSFLPVLGSRDAYRFVALLLLVLYVAAQTEEIRTGRARWYQYLVMALFCYLSMNGHEGNIYIMLGLFFAEGLILLFAKTPARHLFACGASVLAGTLLGATKTIRIFLTTGRLSSSTILPFHDTPVVEQIAAVNNNRADRATVLASYSLELRFLIVLGLIGLLVMLAVSWRKKDKRTAFFALLVLGMLLPMTGVLDWIGYEVSLWFAEQLRYRMYFLMLFAVTGAWLLTRKVRLKSVAALSLAVCLLGFSFFLKAEAERCGQYSKAYVGRCITIVQDYKRIADLAAAVTDGSVFTRNQVVLYYLHGLPKLLYHPYSESLIQARTDEEVAQAVEELNIGAILLPKSGIDYHDYSLLPFWDYINNSEHFSQITPEEGGYSSDIVIFYRNR